VDAVVVVAGALNTVLQAGLSCAFFSFRQATILVTFGISEPHKRKTSGVHADRSSAVPNAMPEVEYDATPITRISAQDQVKIASFFMAFPPTQLKRPSKTTRFWDGPQGRPARLRLSCWAVFKTPLSGPTWAAAAKSH